MATRTHYSKSYLSLVESDQRTPTDAVVGAYERVLGVGGLNNVDRRDFLTLAGVVAANAGLAIELTASLAGNDPIPLTAVQTTHGTDLAVASLVDRRSVIHLRRWLENGDDPVLRVNAAGILAKVPGQAEAARVTAALRRDDGIRARYLTAVIARVCGVAWPLAAQLAGNAGSFPQPRLAAQRFAQETVNGRDAGARWCSSFILQALSPVIGR
jgi:hypothetical protein